MVVSADAILVWCVAEGRGQGGGGPALPLRVQGGAEGGGATAAVPAGTASAGAWRRAGRQCRTGAAGEQLQQDQTRPPRHSHRQLAGETLRLNLLP